MKNTLFIIVYPMLLSLVACQGNGPDHTAQGKTDSAFAIIGKVTGQDTGTIYLTHRQSGIIDSARLDHGFFKFNGKADTAEYGTIRLGEQVKGFFLENGKISMLIKKDSLPLALITGTRAQDEFNAFELLGKSLNDASDSLDKAYDRAIRQKNKKGIDSIERQYDRLDAEQKKLVSDFAQSHPASIVSAFEIYNNFSYNPRLGEIDSLYHGLDTSVRNTYFGRKIGNVVDKEKLTAIGRPAPEFSLNDADGNPVTLSSFKGTYLLVDFWASWCGPCRRENPNVVKAYHQFQKRGFEIFGVSLDHDKEKWVNAVKADKLDWTQVSDLKGWKSDVAIQYGVQGIPMNYLLDRKGIIIAKGLRGDQLETRLAELLPAEIRK